MSTLEWLAGEAIIPAAEVANLKRAFRKRHNILIEKAYDEAKRFRAANSTSSATKWKLAIESATHRTPDGAVAKHLALRVARSLPEPRAIKWDDFTEIGLGKAGVSAAVIPFFSPNGETIGEVRFQSRRVIWEIHEGNHAVDVFKETEDSVFLYTSLNNIAWVKGTGGGESFYTEREDTIIQTQSFGVLKRRYEHCYPTTPHSTPPEPPVEVI